MSDDPSVHVEVLRNARNFQIREQKNVIIHRNQNISASDQATLIELLQPILDASHTRDRETSPPNSACFPGTRTDVIRMIVAWADSTLLWNTHVLWLYGFVGCGKSAIALAIALKFERRERLVASFFFFRNAGDRSRMIKFAATLACQLAAAIPEAAPFIEKAVKAEPGLLTSSLGAQLRRLVYEPFKAAARRGRLVKTALLKGPFLIVIDGLDECDDRQDVQAFIDDMLEFFKKNPLIPLRFLITSRVEQHIQGHLENKQVRLENLINHCSHDDIDTFMCTCFEAEKRRNPVIKAYIQNHGDWPTKEDKDVLVEHIGGSFIFASALFKYIIDPTDDQSTPMDRLPHTLNMNPGLDTLYTKALSRSQHLPHFLKVTSTLALLFEPLPITGFAELLGIEPFEVVRVLVNLQAIIHIPGTDDLPVTMCHTSLRDFLTTESRSGPFFAPSSFHLYLIVRCLQVDLRARTGTAVTSYITDHFEDHLRLPAVEAVHARALAKLQFLPRFADIMFTITSLPWPGPFFGIADLLGIETSETYRIMPSLQVIIDSPGIDEDKPAAICQASLPHFLTSRAQSWSFSVSPLYHLILSYCCFSLKIEQLQNHDLSIGTLDHQKYWYQFLNATSKRRILPELKQLPSLIPHRAFSYHLFSFTQVFVSVFADVNHGCSPLPVMQALVKCIESLALAVNFDPAPDKWLQASFNQLGFQGRLTTSHVSRLEINRKQAASLQRKIDRTKNAIVMKYPRNLLPPDGLLDQSDPYSDDGFYHVRDTCLSNWPLMKAYRLLKWIANRLQQEAALRTTATDVTCDLKFSITVNRAWRDCPGRITICAPSRSSR